MDSAENHATAATCALHDRWGPVRILANDRSPTPGRRLTHGVLQSYTKSNAKLRATALARGADKLVNRWSQR